MAWYNAWFFNLLSKQAVEPIKPKSMPVAKPKVVSIPLKLDQYYQGVHTKKYIVCHHTAGGSAASSIGSWAANPARIATPYVIDRDGTIYEAYDPKFWCYHLGAGIKSLEQQSIGIEICSYGSLGLAKVDKPGKYKKGDFVTYTDRVIAPEKTVRIPAFRPTVNPFATKPGLEYKGELFEAYTPEQIASLKLLIPYLMDKFKIPKQPDIDKFIEYQNPAKLPPGIYSHTTVRKDKIDVFPQPSLVELIKSL